MAEIKFVREYKINRGGKYEHTYYDIVYVSGRIYTRYITELPATITKWLEGKTGRKQYDKFHGEEIIYKEAE